MNILQVFVSFLLLFFFLSKIDLNVHFQKKITFVRITFIPNFSVTDFSKLYSAKQQQQWPVLFHLGRLILFSMKLFLHGTD